MVCKNELILLFFLNKNIAGTLSGVIFLMSLSLYLLEGSESFENFKVSSKFDMSTYGQKSVYLLATTSITCIMYSPEALDDDFARKTNRLELSNYR